MRERDSSAIGNFVGAFADGAVLFPLLAVLSMRTDFSGVTLLVSAGLAYLTAGFIFRVPMSVQPLKAIAIASVAIGASSAEIRISAGLIGVIAAVSALLPIDRWAEKVPRTLVHGLQFGFGIILAIQGIKIGGGSQEVALAGLLAIAMVAMSFGSRVPMLGIVATGGLVWALFHGQDASRAASVNAAAPNVRTWIILSLVFPQLVLTASNSLIGTMDVSRRYFGKRASRVTAKRLLGLIGLGNIASALIGGMPFCHGSGGVTAHVRGGSTHWSSNLLIGCTLLILAAFQGSKTVFALSYPPLLISSLLIATGVFHVQLVKPSWCLEDKSNVWQVRAQLIVMAVAALITQNMIWVFATGVGAEILRWKLEAAHTVEASP